MIDGKTLLQFVYDWWVNFLGTGIQTSMPASEAVNQSILDSNAILPVLLTHATIIGLVACLLMLLLGVWRMTKSLLWR